MAGNILPIVAIAGGAYLLMSSKGKKKTEAKAEDAKSAEDEVAGDVDDAIADKEAQPSGTPTIQPSGPPREETVPAAQPQVVDTGIAGKGSYRVVKLSDAPPRFEAQITNDMQNYSSVGQFETEETAVAAAKQAGIETFGSIGR